MGNVLLNVILLFHLSSLSSFLWRLLDVLQTAEPLGWLQCIKQARLSNGLQCQLKLQIQRWKLDTEETVVRSGDPIHNQRRGTGRKGKHGKHTSALSAEDYPANHYQFWRQIWGVLWETGLGPCAFAPRTSSQQRNMICSLAF